MTIDEKRLVRLIATQLRSRATEPNVVTMLTDMLEGVAGLDNAAGPKRKRASETLPAAQPALSQE